MGRAPRACARGRYPDAVGGSGAGMMIESAMILAAGFGTRMRELTENCPKPLLAVAGRPLIDHALGMVAEAGISRAVVNLHPRGEQIRPHLAGRPRAAML